MADDNSFVQILDERDLQTYDYSQPPLSPMTLVEGGMSDYTPNMSGHEQTLKREGDPLQSSNKRQRTEELTLFDLIDSLDLDTSDYDHRPLSPTDLIQGHLRVHPTQEGVPPEDEQTSRLVRAFTCLICAMTFTRKENMKHI